VSAVRMRARSDLRSRAASVVVLTVMIGLVGGVAMASLAGARRIDTAYARYRDATHEADAVVLGCRKGFVPPVDMDAVAALPIVASSELLWALNPVGGFTADGHHPLFGHQDPFEAGLVAPEEPGTTPAPHVIEGRMPETIDEVALPWGHLANASVGDDIVVRMISKEVSLKALRSSGPSPDALLPDVRLTVVGIVLTPGGLNGTDGTILATDDFYRAYRDSALSCAARSVQLAGGLRDLPEFGIQLSRAQPGAFYFDTAQEASLVERTTHLRSIVMRLFGWLVAIAGVLVLGQALVRRALLGSVEDPILRALGMSRRQIALASLASAAIIGIGGAVLAMVVALALSPFTETGLARFIDPDHGVRIDVTVLVVGCVSLLAMALLLTGLPAWRLAGARGGVMGAAELHGSERPSRLASLVARLGAPASVSAGSRLALEPGHGRTATPVRSGMMGVALTVAAMVASFGFAASMRHFVETPALWGITATFGVGNPFDPSGTFADRAVPILERDPGFSDLSYGNFQNAIYLSSPSDAVSVSAWGLSAAHGQNVVPTMLQGRWPDNDDEIALGSTTLRTLGLRVGDTVHATAGGTERDLSIVGVPVFPDFGFGPGLGVGAGLTFEGLKTFYPDLTENLVFGRYGPGVVEGDVLDRVNPLLKKLDTEYHAGDIETLGDSTLDAQRSQNVPLILASLFTLSAFAFFVHVLITSVRRRRRDLAILRTLGFTRWQIAATVAWQAASIATVGLVFGVPLGILVGRLAWSLFADRLGVVAVPVVAWAQVLLVIPATIAVAMVISIGPAIAARRTKPAIVLRAE
jgi:ABC-type lipoprotein release transport system permease subunit